MEKLRYWTERLWIWSCKNPSKAVIICLVTAIHLTIVYRNWSPQQSLLPSRPKPKHLAVQSVKLKPPPAPAPKAKPKPKPVAKPKPQPKPVAKKEPAKPAKKPPPKKVAKREKKPAPPKKTEKPVVNAQEERERQELLKQIEQSMAKIEDAPRQERRNDPLPDVKTLPMDQSPVVMTAESNPYRDELVRRLQLMLRLPDLGSVKVKLRLHRSGKVVKLEVLSSQSAKNLAYVQDVLPTVSFTGFGAQFPGEDEHEFLLTLTNDF